MKLNLILMAKYIQQEEQKLNLLRIIPLLHLQGLFKQLMALVISDLK